MSARVERQVIAARRKHRRGQDWLGPELGIAARTVGRILRRRGAPYLRDCDPMTGAVIKASKATTRRYERDRPGELVHVDVGQGDKNQDLMDQYQVPMKRGIPAIAVLDASGRLLYSQKNGEFERARAMGPEDLLEFLNKWKSH